MTDSDTKKYPPLINVVGNVGGAFVDGKHYDGPQEVTTTKGKIVKFSVAKTVGYGDDIPPRWINVAVWNEELGVQIMAKVKKGTAVALEGSIKEGSYNGKPTYDMNAMRIGLVTWFTKSGSSSRKSDDSPPAKAESTVDEW